MDIHICPLSIGQPTCLSVSYPALLVPHSKNLQDSTLETPSGQHSSSYEAHLQAVRRVRLLSAACVKSPRCCASWRKIMFAHENCCPRSNTTVHTIVQSGMYGMPKRPNPLSYIFFSFFTMHLEKYAFIIPNSTMSALARQPKRTLHQSGQEKAYMLGREGLHNQASAGLHNQAPAGLHNQAPASGMLPTALL